MSLAYFSFTLLFLFRRGLGITAAVAHLLKKEHAYPPIPLYLVESRSELLFGLGWAILFLRPRPFSFTFDVDLGCKGTLKREKEKS